MPSLNARSFHRSIFSSFDLSLFSHFHRFILPFFLLSLFSFFLLSLFPSPASAQSDTTCSESLSATLLNDGRAFLRIGGHLGTAPLRWRAHDWLLVGGIVGGTSASALLDDELDAVAQRNQTATLDGFERLGEFYGEGKTILIGTSVFYLTGLFTRDRWIRETALLVGTATVYASLLTRVIKPIMGRARPYMESGNHDFRPLNFRDDYNSLPSGHTVAAFAVSTVLARRIGNPFATVGLYGLAAVTGLSRIYSQQHWFSDVIFGAAVSILMANSVVDWYENGGEAGEETGFHLMPGAGSVTVVFNF